jgi:hypothetical protein
VTARLTREQILVREAAQSKIIASLNKDGHHDVANRLTACMASRVFRPVHSAWRPRCRNAGCRACWDGSVTRYWSSYVKWCEDDQAAFTATVPADMRFAEPIARALRDIRDREARECSDWAEIAIMGITDGTKAHLQVSPWGVPRETIDVAFRQRWPLLDTHRCDDGPRLILDTDVRARLATLCRGSAPLRFYIKPQRLVEQSSVSAVIPFDLSVRSPTWSW